MKLYTSYWYNVRFFPHNLICLSTVVWKPKYPVKDSTGQSPIIIDCEPFKPGKSCEGLCDGKCIPKHSYDCAFLKNYREQLKQISGEEFLNHLNHLEKEICKQEGFDSVDFALIVYEKPSNPCSERQAILEWADYNGLAIEEWRKEK